MEQSTGSESNPQPPQRAAGEILKIPKAAGAALTPPARYVLHQKKVHKPRKAVTWCRGAWRAVGWARRSELEGGHRFLVNGILQSSYLGTFSLMWSCDCCDSALVLSRVPRSSEITWRKVFPSLPPFVAWSQDFLTHTLGQGVRPCLW